MSKSSKKKEEREQEKVMDDEKNDVMCDETVDSLNIHIKDMLLRDLHPTSTKRSMYRVPENLRTAAEGLTYEPCMLAIGPYYRGKKELQAMEQQKRWYLNMLLHRTGETDVKRYIQAIRALEKEARSFYAENVINKFTSDEFVKMMLLDGFFVVELLRRYVPWDNTSYSNSFNSLGWDNNKLARDLLLVENQIPFSVVEKLFEMTQTAEERLPNEPNMDHERPIRTYLFLMIFYFFNSSVLHHQSLSGISEDPTGDIKHLLSLIHRSWFSSSESLRANMKFDLKKLEDMENWKFISCATELREAGIKFKVAEAKGLSKVKFDNGTLYIPRLTITGQSESIFKNLIVYEQYFLQDKNLTISNYIKFMDCLINSSKDVKLLCKRNILHNRLGDHEVVANLFNKLGDFFTPSGPDSYYCEVFKSVEDHCRRRRNLWIAVLKHRYFDSPWAAISIFAAVVLLLLTLGQTVFAVLAYYYK